MWKCLARTRPLCTWSALCTQSFLALTVHTKKGRQRLNDFFVMGYIYEAGGGRFVSSSSSSCHFKQIQYRVMINDKLLNFSSFYWGTNDEKQMNPYLCCISSGWPAVLAMSCTIHLVSKHILFGTYRQKPDFSCSNVPQQKDQLSRGLRVNPKHLAWFTTVPHKFVVEPPPEGMRRLCHESQ